MGTGGTFSDVGTFQKRCRRVCYRKVPTGRQAKKKCPKKCRRVGVQVSFFLEKCRRVSTWLNVDGTVTSPKKNRRQVSLKELAGEVQESICPEQVSLEKLSARLWPAKEAGTFLGMARKAYDCFRFAPFLSTTCPELQRPTSLFKKTEQVSLVKLASPGTLESADKTL